MALTFNGAQVQVDEWVNKHPDGYREDEKLFEKITEEQKEMRDALDEYQKDPTDEHLQKFKIEIGDELFAIICLANSKGIALDECFNLMMGKNRKRAQNGYIKEK